MHISKLRYIPHLFTSIFLILLIAIQAESNHHPQYMTQRHAPIEWIKVPNTTDQFYMAQRTSDAVLLLTPNESFYPKLGLRAEGKGKVPDNDRKLNKGSSFEVITQWDANDQAEWGIWLEEAGEITIDVTMSQTMPGDQFSVTISNRNQTLSFQPSTNKDSNVATLTLTIDKPGRHALFFNCDDKTQDSKPALHSIQLTGPAIKNAAVLRKRWRPAAAHTRFSSSQNPTNIRLWIMEMDATPGDLGFYSPITTPFGYYGPSWLADGTVNSKMNFSFWSYGRNKPEPPVEHLSHLIAIGNPTATFGHFGHEGTGVKIRDWDPLKNRQGQRQVLALRIEPGKMYDTYFSYFFAEDEKRWRLFGAGKKYNKEKPLQSLWVGSFVEVPGRSSVQRTGAYERQMRYRGWIVDTSGKVYPLDQMRGGNIEKETKLTHTHRGITDDGRFFLQTGGWAFRRIDKTNDISLTLPKNLPQEPFLNSASLAFLQTIPSQIIGKKVERNGTSATVTFDIENLGQDPQLEMYWGHAEGLTLAKRWANKTPVTTFGQGPNTFTLKKVKADKPLFVRLLLKNDQGQFWSKDTLKTPATK